MNWPVLQPGETAEHGQRPLRFAQNGRAAAMLWVVLFCACMVFVYIDWLYPHYWYLGFPLSPGEHPVLWLSVPLVLMSAALLPTQILRLSDFALWMLFFFVYVPSMLFVPLQGLLRDDGLVYVCALALSFTILQLMAGYRMQIAAVVVSRRSFITLLFSVFVALNLYVLAVYGGNLKLAGLAEIYIQRAEASDLAQDSLVGYASGALTGAINPFLIAVGLTERRKLWLWLGILGQIFIYATAAMKSVVLSIMLMPLFYYALICRRSISGARLGVIIFASCIVPLILTRMIDEDANPIGWQIVSLIFMRTYGMTGALSGVYADFFVDHPHTYFSHVNALSTFVHYPYQQSLGEEVGWYMVGSKLDANANFWASDGTASLGNLGVVLMGAVVGGFLLVANGLLRPSSRRLALVAFIPFVVNISNTSFFTGLLSGGGVLLLLMIYVWQSVSPAFHEHCRQGSKL